jgi:hypothetical protein
MILTELIHSANPPRRRRRGLSRRLHYTRLRTKRYLKAHLRKARSKTNAAIKRQYFLSDAFAESRTAIKLNEDIYIGMLMAAAGIGFAFAVLISEIAILFFQTAYDFAEATGVNMLLITSIATGVLLTLSAWMLALLLNTFSIAVLEGANRKIYRSIRTTFRRALSHAPHTAAMWLMVTLLITVPIGVTVGLAALYFFFNPATVDQLLILAPYASIAALIWIVTVLINYGLAPHIALYEQPINIRQSFQRSRHLVTRKGRVFMLFYYLTLTASIAGAYSLAKIAVEFGLPFVLLFAPLTFIIFLQANNVLVSFYRKRRLARKY